MASVKKCVVVVVSLLIACQLATIGCSAGSRPSVTVPSTPTDYVYDATGRLVGITQITGSAVSARYHFDDSGNITSIERSPSTAVTIASVVPTKAAAGAMVTVSGTGFATTPADNTVIFNGTPATVTAATPTTLTVTVPTGPATGVVSVRTSAGSADSPQPFTADPAAVPPSVTGFAPVMGAAGTSVTISGSGFDASAANNTVAFGFTRARVTAATPTSLTVTVPEAAGSGRITVGTATGASASSGTDFVVVPRGYNVGDVAATGSLAVDQAPATLTVPTAGKVGLLRFAGTKGQRLSLGLTGSTIPDFSVALFTPYGASFARDEYDLPQSSRYLYGGLELPPLPSDGVYQVVIAPSGTGTGAVTATLSSRITGALHLTGNGTPVRLGRAGQHAELSLPVTAGQRIDLGFTASSLPPDTTVTLTVREPNGTPLLWDSKGATRGLILADGAGDYDFTAGQTGTYTVLLGSSDASTGTLTVTASPALDAGSITLGTPKVVTIGRPGQDARLSYAGIAGQPLSLDFTEYTFAQAPYLTLTAPDGSVLAAAKAEHHVDLPALPATGTYTITLSPYSSTGSATLQLSTRPTTTGPGVQPPGGFRFLPAVSQAAPGMTALSGRLRSLDGRPLAGVTVSVEGVHVTSDAQGRFLLAGLRPGHHVLRVDGASASTPDRRFGLFDIGVDVDAGRTTTLPYPIWMPPLDTEHLVRFPSPADREVVLTTPAIPGLEVHLPPGAVIRDTSGTVVTELGITAIPVDRPPFPLPGLQVPVYFTVQPGSASVFPAGARVIYPNYYPNAPPGSTMDFWHYDPTGRGWFVYGHGKVTPDGKQVTPDPGTEVYQFTGAMLIEPGVDAPPETAPVAGGGAGGGDPVDLGTGLLRATQTDLALPDTLPISVTRTYQQSDTGRRAFGIGVNVAYNIYLFAQQQWVDGQLILPDGSRVRYHRITPGGTGPSDFRNAVFAADPTPTGFAGSVLAWNGNGFDIRLRDGTTLVFGDESPLQAIRDRYGNTITITRAPAPADPDGKVRAKGPITQVTSPNGRWISFSYDSGNRITRAEDNLGRAVTYSYTPDGHLATVTSATGATTTYTYDAQGRLATARDPRGAVYLTNVYDPAGRVAVQTLADGATYRFSYLTDSAGKVTETRLTDPRGTVRRLTFNAAGFLTSHTTGYGTADAQTTTITRDPTSNLPLSITDALGRRTELSHDGYGHLVARTQLAGTSSARTERFAYEGPYDQLSRYTDALGRVTTFTYLGNGAPHTTTDPLSRVTTVDTNARGQVTRVTDNLGHATTYGYLLGELITATDPLGHVSRRVSDAAGRTVVNVDPLGALTGATYDAGDRIQSITDPLGRITRYGYDANGNLTTVTDPRGHVTTFTYDTQNRPIRVSDPLNRVTSIGYDPGGNRTSLTTPLGTVTRYAYDGLGRLVTASYGVTGAGAESQTSYTYDLGNRVTSIADSLGGTVSFTLDGFNRVIRSTAPQGQIDYTFDVAGQRSGMTVAGQPPVSYGYDAAGQLITLQRDADEVSIGYDGAGGRSSVTLPNGIVQSYTYDPAGRLTTIHYGQDGSTLGEVSYAYDGAGRVTHVGGSYARAEIPASYGPASYDAADQLTQLGSTGYTYDADGHLTSDGVNTYDWDARGQLTSRTHAGQTTSYTYDGLGRRIGRAAGPASTGYLYDGLNVVQELSGGAPAATVLAGGLDEVFARTSGGDTRSLLTDALGSTIAVADASGAVTGRYSYQPFGSGVLTGDDGGNPTRFTGREDEGNGLYHYRARYYSTSDQRFLSRDPIGFDSGDTNLYAYVFGRPTMLADPLGTDPPGSEPPGTAMPEPPEDRIPLGDGTYYHPADGSIRDAAGQLLGSTGGAGGQGAAQAGVVAEARGGVYSLRDPVTGEVVRTGRTNDLARRELEHLRDPELSEYEFRPEYRTDVYAEQRGLEQMLHNKYNPPLNKIRPISPSNPRLPNYLQAAYNLLFGGGG